MTHGDFIQTGAGYIVNRFYDAYASMFGDSAIYVEY